MRDLSIDCIKCVAMFLVMTLHVPLAVRPDLILSAGGYLAGIAIPLFFMVSGWLLIGNNKTCKYSVKKIFAIIKFVAIIAVLYYGVESFINHNFSWIELCKSVVNPFIQRGMFSIFWYLGAMCIIYASLPIINKIHHKWSLTGLALLLLSLFVIECFVYPLNILYNFEQTHVIQTFRLWNWMFYFVLGGTLKFSYNRSFHIPFWVPVLMAMIYIIFGTMLLPRVHAVEYLFSAPLCMIFATIVFCYFAGLKFKLPPPNGFSIVRVVQFLSNLFLPVYAFHIIVIISLRNIPPNYFGVLRPIVFLLLTYTITIFCSWIVMKIPKVNTIFRL